MTETRRIVIIEGHPDPSDERFGHALAEAYAAGAIEAGHTVRRVRLAALEVPLLRSQADWEHGALPEGLLPGQQAVGWADHIVLLYPLWLGSLPALLKAWLEQCFRPGFAIDPAKRDKPWQRMLAGKSARVVVTMGMPALAYRWFYRAHSLKSLERNILRFTGIGPIRESLIGMAAAPDSRRRTRWLARMRALGAAGR